MRAVVVPVVVLGLLVPLACSSTDPKADGAACGSNDDCKSKSCREGFCAGSDCAGNKAACSAGWSCVHVDPDLNSGVVTGSDTCQPTCGSCPPNQYCTKIDRPGDSICKYGKPPLDIAIHAPLGVAGKSVHIVASETSGDVLVSCEWQLSDGTKTSGGPELVHTFAAPESYQVSATCSDAAGRSGTGQGSVDVAAADPPPSGG